MIRHLFDLTCDECGATYGMSHDPRYTSVSEAREVATEEGWTRHGRHGDLCPACSAAARRPSRKVTFTGTARSV